MTTLFDKITERPGAKPDAKHTDGETVDQLFRRELQVILARTINLCLAVDESCSLSDFAQLKDIALRLRTDVNKMQSYITRG